MIKMYNLKILYKAGDETIPSLNLFALASELEKLGCTAKEFDRVSDAKKGGIVTTDAFQVKRYN